jgi:membrane-bound lytic murein transglycosylase D
MSTVQPSRGSLVILFALGSGLAGCQSLRTDVPPSPEALAAAPPTPTVITVVPERVPRPDIVLESIPAPTDLLSRLREKFALETTSDPTVEREIAWYAQNPAYLDRVFTRGTRYLYYITEELERRGMPADLALLPVVESAFDPFAYSHGRASGLWQIIPGTGRRLGLAQNWWFDGRRDVVESTRAALDYLQALHAQLGGDWLLAVAGYNSGEGNVARALKRAQAAGEPADFWSIRQYLPVETRTYVPRLIAIRTLVAEPHKHGVALPEVPNAPYFSIVETGGQIDMALAAELSALDLDQLYELNPGINRWATDPDGPHRLLVPEALAATFTAALAALGERERVQWTRHQIRNGETLSQLAEKYHTTEGVLREINGLRSNLIRAGGYLMVPHASAALDSYTQSATARAARQMNRPRSGERLSHVVQPGDSLWSISMAYDVNVRELAAWNAMAPGDVLSVGREVVIWTNGGATSASPATASTNADRTQIRRIEYVVRRGDSLSSIASRFKVTVAKLLEWNASASKEKYLQPGQRLVMYVDVTEQTA